MQSEIISFAGWEKNLRLFNNTVELIITLEVGPRILSYRHHGGENILKQYEDQLGTSGETEWRIRGGHRLWAAPEDLSLTYHIDNTAVDFTSSEKGEIILTSHQHHPARLRKEMAISLKSSSHVILNHSIFNEGSSPITLAPWALTVMAPGGMEVIPQPPLGEHPQDLSPNRNIVLWPYTDLSDSRWNFHARYITLEQRAASSPTKLGLAHRERWIAYLLNNNLFIKSFAFEEGASYPDGGCNFETFSNSEMIEIESLGPLKKLHPGECVTLREDWHLLKMEDLTQTRDSFKNWLPGIVEKCSL